MHQPTASKPTLRNRSLLIFVSLLALLVVTGLAFGAFALSRQPLVGLFSTPTPTPPCGDSRLQIGSSIYQILPAPSTPSSVFPAIPGEPGVVYWIASESPHYTLVFNPDRQNQIVLGTLSAGMPVSVSWEDCSTGGYTVQSIELSDFYDPAQVDRNFVGVILYLPLDATGRGLVVIAALLVSGQ